MNLLHQPQKDPSNSRRNIRRCQLTADRQLCNPAGNLRFDFSIFMINKECLNELDKFSNWIIWRSLLALVISSLLWQTIIILLYGNLLLPVREIMFSWRLITLQKKDGGFRSIAMRYILRRLASKCANNYIIVSRSVERSPFQVNVGMHSIWCRSSGTCGTKNYRWTRRRWCHSQVILH